MYSAKLNGRRGFGVAEALVFSAVASVFVMSTVALIGRSVWQVRLVNIESARNALGIAMRAQMADPTMCSIGLVNLAPMDHVGTGTAEIGFTLVNGRSVRAGVSPDAMLDVKSLHLSNLAPSGLIGSAGFPMQTGTLVLDAQGLPGSGAPTMRPVSLGTMYVEVNGPNIVSCFNDDGPFGAAAMACVQLGGVNQSNNSSCDTTAFRNSVNATIQGLVRSELDNQYMNFVMGETDTQLAIAVGTVDHPGVLAQLINSAAGATNASAQTSQGSINGGFAASNQAINASNNDRATRVNDLWTGVQAASNTAAGAASVASQANSTATQANQTAQGAQASSSSSYQQSVNVVNTATYANSVATNANGVAQNAVAVANQALGSANSANGIANGANGTAQYANYVANVAYGTANTAVGVAQSAYNTGTSAYNTANGAYGTAAYAYNTANGANANAYNAYVTEINASGQASNALGLGQAAYYHYNYTYNSWTQPDCSQMGGQSCP